MAATKSGNSGIFWMNDVSDDDRPLVFVPGVGGEGKTQVPLSVGSGSTSRSSKRGTKLRARHSSDWKTEAAGKTGGKKQAHLQSERSGVYAKDKVSVHHSAAAATEQTLSPALGPVFPLTQEISETSKSLVCLKDLCPEDKRRIANLIEELARVSEEKEESVQRLKDEQGNFECKILKLEQQNQIIIQERESLQQQYRECQELLGLYQQYISQQQAKLNQSIAQLSQEPAYSKVLSSEEAPSRTCTSAANGSLFDGSYLSLAATRAQQPQVHRTGGGGRGATQTLSNHASLSVDCEFSPTDRKNKQHRSREPHSEPQLRCERSQGNGQDSGSRLENGHHDIFTQPVCERRHSGSAFGSEANEALTRPLLGHEDWEEKRHQLLLQKMQLEMERERLQARLAEQEERLSRQSQQLRQSHLDYSRFRQATQSDLSSSNTRSGDPQPEGPSHQDLPPSVCEVAEAHPAGQSLNGKQPQTVPDTLESDKEVVTRSRKDMATSPVKSPGGLSKPTSVSVIQRTPQARSDFSVVELLDIFSPVPAPELSKMSTGRPRTLPHRLGRTLLTPAGVYPQSTQQDLEESQILEDIFFIC